MAKRLGKLSFLTSMFAATFAALALTNSAGGAAEVEQIRVGAILSAEGIFSSLGTPERQGIELAVDQLNKDGGVGGKKINLVVYDDGGDQAKAVQLANRLIFQDKVAVIFGPSITPTAEMVAPVIEQNNVVEIGYVAQDYVWQGTKNIFMSMPRDAINAEAMVLYAAKDLSAKKVAVAYANVPYGVNGNKFLQQMAQKYGLEVVGSEKWGETDIDFTSQAAKLKQANPDVILLWGSCSPSDAQVVKAIRDSGEHAPFVGNLCISSPQVPQIAGKAADAMVSFSVLDYAHPDAETAAFIKAFTEKFGQAPAPFAATSYDSVRIWAKAAERAGGKTDTASVAEALIGLSYKGVSGQFALVEDNHNGLSPEAYKTIVVKDGKWSSK